MLNNNKSDEINNTVVVIISEIFNTINKSQNNNQNCIFEQYKYKNIKNINIKI